VVTARRVEQIQDITSGFEETMLDLPLDVTNQDQINNVVANTIAKFGRFDVLVNNAGIGYFGSDEESIE
jgi:NADP-dependent 3-hydroxy acid dehydrogenase YdfG